MRFTRHDLPGIAIAVLAPAGAMYLFLAAFETWHHEGTPLLGFMATNLAIGPALIAAFSRFVRRWDAILAALLLLLAAVAGVIWAQRTGHDGTAIATLLKWIGVAAFGLLNIAIVLPILTNGLLPILDRREARRRAEREAAEAAQA